MIQQKAASAGDKMYLEDVQLTVLGPLRNGLCQDFLTAIGQTKP